LLFWVCFEDFYSDDRFLVDRFLIVLENGIWDSFLLIYISDLSGPD